MFHSSRIFDVVLVILTEIHLYAFLTKYLEAWNRVEEFNITVSIRRCHVGSKDIENNVHSPYWRLNRINGTRLDFGKSSFVNLTFTFRWALIFFVARTTGSSILEVICDLTSF